jgi:hypothetical protein
MEETVAEHFAIAEYVGSDFSQPLAGHLYSFHNDPGGHGDHVHVAFLPFGEPDEPHANPPVFSAPTERARAFFDAVFDPQRFPGTSSGGVVSRKHRNQDEEQPWSQHTFGNAVDIMCNHETADKIIAWLNGPMEEDVDAIQDTMLRRQWFMLAAAADEFDIQHPLSPEEDAEVGDDEPFKGWAGKVGRRLAERQPATP